MKKLFSPYGPVWIGESSTKPTVYNFAAALNNSFKFLIPKHRAIPSWILKSNTLFLSFLAGYTDAEGSIGIYNKRAKFRLGSYDKLLLEQIHDKLNLLKIESIYQLERRAGIYYGQKLNGDFYRLTINNRFDLYSLFTKILSDLKHDNRRQHVLQALANVGVRI